MADRRKTYLGDGAYAEFDGFGITLTTEDGISVQNEIFLEPEVYASLERFAKSCWTPREGDGKEGKNG